MTAQSDATLTHAITTRPVAFFIGPRKTGTSWVNLYLEARDDVLTPHTTKETFFFDRYYARGGAWYLKQFPASGGEDLMLAECAPSYAGSAVALDRVAECLPDLRLVITLRDPVSRVQSHWRHLIRYGQNAATLFEAMEEGQELWADSQYASILEKAVGLVGADRVSVVLYEDLRRDPAHFAKAICACIGLPFIAPREGATDRKMNAAQRPRNPALSALATRGAETLRNMGLHRIVRAARKAGLRNMLERPYDKDESAIDPTEALEIRARLAPQVDRLVQQIEAHPGLVPLGEAERVTEIIKGWGR